MTLDKAFIKWFIATQNRAAQMPPEQASICTHYDDLMFSFNNKGLLINVDKMRRLQQNNS